MNKALLEEKWHFNMDENTNNCTTPLRELKELCRKYLNNQIDQTTYLEKINELKKSYEADGTADFSFEYLLICGYLNLFSEYSPNEKIFGIDVEKLLSKIEKNPYISESWLVTFKKNHNKDIELLYKYWTDSVPETDKEKDSMMLEMEKILNNKIPYPCSVRDVVYNSILAIMSMKEPDSEMIWANHSVGADNCSNQKIGHKLNYLFDVWFGKAQLFFEFNYVAGNVYIWIV